MIEITSTESPWPRMPLGELCDIRGGFPAPQKDEAFLEGEIPFVRMKDVGRYHLTNNLNQTEQALNRKHFENGRYMLTPRGSILMPRSGSVALNHRAILTIDAVIVSHLCALVPNSSKITTEFLYHFLCRTDMRKLTKKTTGLDSIAFSDLRLIAIPLPPLDEQKRIAAILDAADALRAKRRQSIAQLDALIQSTFLDLFGDPVTNPIHPTRCIAEIVSRIIDYRGKSPEKTSEGIPLITAKIVKKKGIDKPNEFIAETAYDSWMRRGIPSPQDVIITTEAPMGEVALVPDYKAAFAQRLLVLQPKREILEPIYLMWALTMPFVTRQMDQRATGSTVTGIRSKEFRKVEVPLPPLSLQQKFAAIVESIESQKTTQRTHLAELDDLFAALQHRAFRGEL